MTNRINVWNRGPVKIYPHLSWNGYLDDEQLKKVANDVKKELSDLKVTVWPQSTYCYETNGTWNVTLSILDNSNDSLRNYIYMIRRDKKFNKIFSCPIINTEYINELNELPLLKEHNETLFMHMENALIKVLGPATYINYFET